MTKKKKVTYFHFPIKMEGNKRDIPIHRKKTAKKFEINNFSRIMAKRPTMFPNWRSKMTETEQHSLFQKKHTAEERWETEALMNF